MSFLQSVSEKDIEALGKALAAKYAGTVIIVLAQAVHGVALHVPDANAADLAKEPQVCWVEQSTTVKPAGG